MIRFIDLRHVSEDLGGDRFAFFDTVTNCFISDDIGKHTWVTLSGFIVGCLDSNLLRYVDLTPEWAKNRLENDTT